MARKVSTRRKGVVKEVIKLKWSFPGGSQDKESACNAGDPGSGSLAREDPLEKEMATHSSILAWRIPRMEEPGGL